MNEYTEYPNDSYTMTQKEFIQTRQILLESLFKRLRSEKLLSETQVKRIQLEKAIEKKELFEF